MLGEKKTKSILATLQGNNAIVLFRDFQTYRFWCSLIHTMEVLYKRRNNSKY